MTGQLVFSAREYRQDVQTVLAACDAPLTGTLHKEGQRQLDVSEAFYGGSQVDKETLAMMMRNCTIGNFVGEATVAVAVEAGVIAPENIATVAGVPHAQMMRL